MWAMRIGIILACWFAVWVVTGFTFKYEMLGELRPIFDHYQSLFRFFAIFHHFYITTLLTFLIVVAIWIVSACWVRWSESKNFPENSN